LVGYKNGMRALGSKPIPLIAKDEVKGFLLLYPMKYLHFMSKGTIKPSKLAYELCGIKALFTERKRIAGKWYKGEGIKIMTVYFKLSFGTA